MSECCDATIATQVVELLAERDAKALLAFPEFREAIVDLVKQGREDDDFRERILSHLGGEVRSRKVPRKNNADPDDGEIAKFFAGKRAGRMKHLKTALKSLDASPIVERLQYQYEESGRKRMMQRYRDYERRTHRTEGQRRLLMVVITSEIYRLQEEEEGEEQSLGAAEDRFAQLSDENTEDIRGLCKSAQKYMVLAGKTYGLGFLLMLGDNCRDVWEHCLNERGTSLIWEFCVAHRGRLVDRAKELQAEACEIVRQCFQENEYRAFWAETNVFTRHFRDAYKFQDPEYARPQAPMIAVQQHQPVMDFGNQQFGHAPNMVLRSQGARRQSELLPTSEPAPTPDAGEAFPIRSTSNASIAVHQGLGSILHHGRNSDLIYGLAANEVQELPQQDCSNEQYGYQSFNGMNAMERLPVQDASYGIVPFSDSGNGQSQAIEPYETGGGSDFDWNAFLQLLGDPSNPKNA